MHFLECVPLSALGAALVIKKRQVQEPPLIARTHQARTSKKKVVIHEFQAHLLDEACFVAIDFHTCSRAITHAALDVDKFAFDTGNVCLGRELQMR